MKHKKIIFPETSVYFYKLKKQKSIRIGIVWENIRIHIEDKLPESIFKISGSFHPKRRNRTRKQLHSFVRWIIFQALEKNKDCYSVFTYVGEEDHYEYLEKRYPENIYDLEGTESKEFIKELCTLLPNCEYHAKELMERRLYLLPKRYWKNTYWEYENTKSY